MKLLRVVVVTLAVCCGRLSEGFRTEPKEVSTVLPLVSSESVVSARRVLRTDKYEGDDTNDSVNGTNNDGEERGGGLPMSELEKTVANVKTTVSEKLSGILPIRTQMKLWRKDGKSIEYVQKALGLDQLTGSAFTTSKYYKYYDQYVRWQLETWVKKDLSLDDVAVQLELSTLTSNPNYKYFDEFVTTQNVDPTDVMATLKLNKLTGDAFLAAPNYELYEKYMAAQVNAWTKQDLSTNVVLKNLGLDKLSGAALTSNLNYYYYYYDFMKAKLSAWVKQGLSADDVMAKLGLHKLYGTALKSSPNYKFYQNYVKLEESTRLTDWLSDDFPTYAAWVRLGLNKVSPGQLKSTDGFRVYEKYVKMQLDKMINSAKNGKPVVNVIVRNGSEAEKAAKAEIWAASGRTREYAKYVLAAR